MKALPGRGHLGDQSPRSAPILVCGRAAGRDRDGRDQTMSCIHGGLGQSQAGASRPRAAPPATARARENPASGRPSAAIPGQGAPRSNCALPRGGDPWCGRRGVPSGHGSRTEGRTHRPFRLELGAVPLRRASSRGREERRRPRRGGQRHPGYRAGDDDGPSGSSQSLRDARLAAARERRRVKGWGGLRGHVSPQPGYTPAAARPHLADARARTPRPARGSRTPRPRDRAARARFGARPTSCACTGAGRRGDSQSASAGQGPPLKSSRGAVREGELRGGRGARGRAGKSRSAGGAGKLASQWSGSRPEAPRK